MASGAFYSCGLSPVEVWDPGFNILGEIVMLVLIPNGGLGIVTVTLDTGILNERYQ